MKTIDLGLNILDILERVGRDTYIAQIGKRVLKFTQDEVNLMQKDLKIEKSA